LMQPAVAEKNFGKAYKFYHTLHIDIDIEVKYKLIVLKGKPLWVQV